MRTAEELLSPADEGHADPAQPEPAKRRQVLEGAREVFRAAGFDGASMGAIAKAAGVSKGTLYVYFDSKEALFEALTHAERRDLAEALFVLDEHDTDVRAVLTRLGESFLSVMMTPEHMSSVRMVIGAADKFPRFGQAFYDAGPRWGTDRLRTYLDRQVAAGRLVVADTDLAAEQFLNLCSAGILKKLLFGVVEDVDRPAIMRNVGGAVDVFLAAYARPATG